MIEEFPTGMGSQDGELGVNGSPSLIFAMEIFRPFGKGNGWQPDPYGTKINDGPIHHVSESGDDLPRRWNILDLVS